MHDMVPKEEWAGSCKMIFPITMEASLIPDNVSYDFCSRVNPNFEKECRDRADGEIEDLYSKVISQ